MRTLPFETAIIERYRRRESSVEEALVERCTVHFYRKVWTAVPTSKGKEVAAMLKAIHAQEDRAAARQKAELVAAKLKEMKLADAAALVLAGIDETLYYYVFPSEHWRCLRTNNRWSGCYAKCDEERVRSAPNGARGATWT